MVSKDDIEALFYSKDQDEKNQLYNLIDQALFYNKFSFSLASKTGTTETTEMIIKISDNCSVAVERYRYETYVGHWVKSYVFLGYDEKSKKVLDLNQFCDNFLQSLFDKYIDRKIKSYDKKEDYDFNFKIMKEKLRAVK